jgi:hypothetical protein
MILEDVLLPIDKLMVAVRRLLSLLKNLPIETLAFFSPNLESAAMTEASGRRREWAGGAKSQRENRGRRGTTSCLPIVRTLGMQVRYTTSPIVQLLPWDFIFGVKISSERQCCCIWYGASDITTLNLSRPSQKKEQRPFFYSPRPRRAIVDTPRHSHHHDGAFDQDDVVVPSQQEGDNDGQ